MRRGIKIFMGMIAMAIVMLFQGKSAYASRLNMFEPYLISTDLEYQNPEIGYMWFNAYSAVYVNFSDDAQTISKSIRPENLSELEVPANTILVYGAGVSPIPTATGDSSFNKYLSKVLQKIDNDASVLTGFKKANSYNIKHIVISNGVDIIPQDAFKGLGLNKVEDVTFGIGDKEDATYRDKSNCTKVDKYGFSGLEALKTINLPESVTELGDFAFAECTSLKKVEMQSVTTLGISCFYKCKAFGPYIEITDKITTIPKSCFFGCSGLRAIILNDKITKIGSNAFASCGLDSIVIPDSVTSIEEQAFATNTKLKTVVFGESLKEVPKNCFNSCKMLNTIKWGKNIETIGDMAFLGCNHMKEIILPEGLKTIGDSAFEAGIGTLPGAQTIIIPEGVTTIGPSAFRGQNATNIDIPASVTNIGNNAFTPATGANVVYEGTSEQLEAINLNNGTLEVTKINGDDNGNNSGNNNGGNSNGGNNSGNNNGGNSNGGNSNGGNSNGGNSNGGNNNGGNNNGGNNTNPPEKDSLTVLALNKDMFYYDGKAHSPKASVYGKNGVVFEGSYGVTSTVKVTNKISNYKPGTYKVTADGVGDVEGSLFAEYTIAVKPTKIKTLKAASKGFKVTVSKLASKYVTGYEVRYSTSKKMSKAKTVTVGKNAQTTSVSIKKLVGKKKYYVQARSYVKIGSKKFYSDWSETKNVTAKK